MGKKHTWPVTGERTMPKQPHLHDPSAESAFHAAPRSIHGINAPAWRLPEGEDHGDDPAAGATAPAQPPAAGSDPGFPANTPIAEMTAEQQVAYWRTQSRKHEQRAEQRGDYDALRAKAEQFDEAQRQAMTEHERALVEAREVAKAEGRSEAMSQVNHNAIKAILTASLSARGKDDAAIAELIRPLNFDAYVTDDAPDTGAIAKYVDSIAGPATGLGSAVRVPDFGQGRRQQVHVSQRDAGLAEARRRFGQPSAS